LGALSGGGLVEVVEVENAASGSSSAPSSESYAALAARLKKNQLGTNNMYLPRLLKELEAMSILAVKECAEAVADGDDEDE
jgi:hypothetical protein